jgi:ankyrin repeat protein
MTYLPEELVKEFVIAGHFDLNKVKSLLADHPHLLNTAYDWGEGNTSETALQAAGHVGNRTIAEFLLGLGAPLDVFAAAMLGRQADVARYLDGDPGLANARGVHHISLMFHAALSGDLAIPQMIMMHGGTEGLSEALHAAVQRGDIAMLRWLLDNGASEVNILNFAGKTPLAVALESGDTAAAEVLRHHGATEA